MLSQPRLALCTWMWQSSTTFLQTHCADAISPATRSKLIVMVFLVLSYGPQIASPTVNGIAPGCVCVKCANCSRRYSCCQSWPMPSLCNHSHPLEVGISCVERSRRGVGHPRGPLHCGIFCKKAAVVAAAAAAAAAVTAAVAARDGKCTLNVCWCTSLRCSHWDFHNWCPIGAQPAKGSHSRPLSKQLHMLNSMHKSHRPRAHSNRTHVYHKCDLRGTESASSHC